MASVEFEKLLKVSGKRTSANRALFLDLVNNAQKYKGYIVYITEIDWDEKYVPFEEPKKFYFNEGGNWQSSDFVNTSWFT